MIELLCTKVAIFLFVLSFLNVIKEIYSLYVAMKLKVKLNSTPKRTFLLGVSLSYIIMSIITGF